VSLQSVVLAVSGFLDSINSRRQDSLNSDRRATVALEIALMAYMLSLINKLKQSSNADDDDNKTHICDSNDDLARRQIGELREDISGIMTRLQLFENEKTKSEEAFKAVEPEHPVVCYLAPITALIII
jgi:hypothetical protein